jgi:large subunit ribosomal protein L3
VLTGLIGKKLGMTQVGDASGRVQAVTVIQLGPCAVTQIKSAPTDGYEAVQVTFGKRKLSRTSSAARGHFQKAEVAPGVATREFVKRGDGELKLGQALAAGDVFTLGDQVDVSGVSKGHGYAGVIKRHHFAGFPGSHGTHEYFRHGGSIGCRLTPQRVHKGKRMAGQMGNEKVTQMNLQLFRILADDNVILVRGSVPGSPNEYVVVTLAATRQKYKRKGMGKEEVRSKNPLKASKKAAAGRG